MKIAVSELIVKYMERLGIEYIFGMPGAHILPVYDSLYHSSVKTVLAKHEQGAAFMACGCARASGRIAACITTAGPGATNLVTGIANAYADRQPILVITGETSTHIFGKGGLQESSGEGGSIDQDELFRSITRYRKVVERTDYLANVLNQASKVLLSPNSGPVLLSIPFNVQQERVDEALLEGVATQQSNHAARTVGDRLRRYAAAERTIGAYEFSETELLKWARQDVVDVVGQALQPRLRTDFGSDMRLQLERVDSIPRSRSGKHRFVMGLRME